MGWMERTKFWRRMGALVDSRVGTAMMTATGGLMNKVVAASLTRKLEGQSPWTPLRKPLGECVVGVVTTAGLHLKGDEPFDVDAEAGDPTFREIPSGFDAADLRVAHTHYPHRYFEQDHGVILPIDRLRELEAGGVFRLARRFFSFGFAGGLTRELVDPEQGSAHRLARELQADAVDAVLLVPA